jgi:hypothetical protein
VEESKRVDNQQRQFHKRVDTLARITRYVTYSLFSPCVLDFCYNSRGSQFEILKHFSAIRFGMWNSTQRGVTVTENAAVKSGDDQYIWHFMRCACCYLRLRNFSVDLRLWNYYGRPGRRAPTSSLRAIVTNGLSPLIATLFSLLIV